MPSPKRCRQPAPEGYRQLSEGLPIAATPRRLAAALLAALFALFALPPPAAFAAACPSGAITLAVPAAEGSLEARLYDLFPPAWHSAFRLQLALTHHPGRGGSYAVAAMLGRPDNGCSVAAVELPSCLYLCTGSDPMFAAADLALIGVFAAAPLALWVDEESSFKSLAELVEQARKTMDETGSALPLAGAGSFTQQHLAVLQLNRAAGIHTQYLPFLGVKQVIAAVRDGQAAACWAPALGRLPGMRPLAVAGEQRAPALPETPTFQEAGIDMTALSVFALVMAATTPESVLREARAALEGLLQDAALGRAMAALGYSPFALRADTVPLFMDTLKKDAAALLGDYLPASGAKR